MNSELAEMIKGRKALAEHEVKDILDMYGFKTPPRVVLSPSEDLGDFKLDFPVVLKASSPEILHKTDIGAIKTGIKDMKELKTELKAMREKFPDAHMLIEEMVKPGVEAIIGVIDDKTFGLAVMVGLGGIYTEVYKDVSFRIVPITEDDADEMLKDLKGRKIFEGFRGIKTDRKSLIRTLVKVSELAKDLEGHLSQMDLNPVFVREKDTIVVDAKMVLKG